MYLLLVNIFVVHVDSKEHTKWETESVMTVFSFTIQPEYGRSHLACSSIH